MRLAFVVALLTLTLVHSASAEERTCVGFGNCSCSNFWESDCICVKAGTSTTVSRNGLCKNYCDKILTSCWNYTRSFSDYNFTPLHCSIPMLEKISTGIVTTPVHLSGVAIMKAWKEVLEVVSDGVDFKLWLRSSNPARRSPDEPVLKKLLLCAQHFYPQISHFYPFLYCLYTTNSSNLTNSTSIPTVFSATAVLANTAACAEVHGVNFTRLDGCARGAMGRSLQTENDDQLTGTASSATPTVFMDSRVYSSQAGKNPRDFLHTLCNVFNSPLSESRAFPWWVFTFLATVALALFIVVWVAKSEGGSLFMHMGGDNYMTPAAMILSVFYGINNQSQNRTGDEVLRLWREGGLEDEDEDMQQQENQEVKRAEEQAPSVEVEPSSGEAEASPLLL